MESDVRFSAAEAVGVEADFIEAVGVGGGGGSC